MHHGASVLITIVAAVGFGLLAQILAHRWRVPAIVLLLGLGILIGDNVLGIAHVRELGDGLEILVKLSVAIILFEGALNLNLRALRQNAAEVRNLVTIGVLISWTITTLLAHYVAGFEWSIAILFGALMTVTGPTVIQPLLRRISVPGSVKTVLEAEAILVDPIGAILAIAALDVILAANVHGSSSLLQVLWAYFGRLLIGGLIGTLGALALEFTLKARNLVPDELTNLVALAWVWVTFVGAELIQSEAGIMAAVIMGLVVQNASIPGARQIKHFKETLTTLVISMLFILLAANLHLSILWAEGLRGVLTVVLVMLVARPLTVFLATWRTKLVWKEKLFMSWVGPRGIIAASVASIFAIALDQSGLPGGERLLALTFLAILITVTLEGLTAGRLARALDLRQTGAQNALIVGANNLGCAIAQLMSRHGRSILLVDTNRASVELAREKGIEAVVGNALEEDTLAGLHAEDYATFLAVTSNSEVNVLAVQMARDAFGIERAFPALTNPTRGANPSLLKQTGGRLAFGRFVPIGEWEKAGEQVYETTWQMPADQARSDAQHIALPDGFLPVLRIRNTRPEVVHADQDWQPGDSIILLCLHCPADADEMLAKI